ncbi:MAG TPA: hypothetical protein VIX73_30075, partial [Kofleriaceae bacterium]
MRGGLMAQECGVNGRERDERRRHIMGERRWDCSGGKRRRHRGDGERRRRRHRGGGKRRRQRHR